MEKEENQNNTSEEQNFGTAEEKEKSEVNSNTEDKKEIKETTPEEKVVELEDKITRTFAEMENQRRRFEKEKEDAYEYGGFAFAKEAINLIDNLERYKQILSNDESIKNSET